MNIKDVENLAELAKLELSDAEKQSLLHDMEGILNYVKQVESVEVDDIQAEHEVHNVWREDDASLPEAGKFSKDLITEQFPDQQDGFLKVKKIL